MIAAAGFQSSTLSAVTNDNWLFLLQVHNTPDIAWIALYPCGALSVNDASLAMVREAATNGAN
jgi:hypothetical protein